VDVASVRAEEPGIGARRALGKYDLCAKLGSGGQATVYLALMRGRGGFHKLVVIKRLHAHGDDPLRISRFLDEARLAARLNHPNIVDTYEVGEEAGEYFIAMEYLEGQPSNRVAHSPVARRRFTPAMWARVASEALRGLGYAHNLTDYNGTPLGIVHRDISPDNVFLTYDGEVKIVDFGIAKALLNSERTETGILKGKISYMAPEQVKGVADHRADLFAMGVVLWGFLTGKRLFEGERGPVLYRLMTEPIPGLATELPDIDPMLAAIVDRALQKDPALRFQTAEEMREALEELIRASGDWVSDVRLGKAVSEAFAETRQRVQRQVQEALSRAAPANLGEAVTIEAQSARAPLPEIGSVTPDRAPTGGAPPSVEIIITPVPVKRRRRLLLVVAGAVIGALALALVIALVARRPSPGTAPRPAAVTPVKITSEPQGVRVDPNPRPVAAVPGAVPAKAHDAARASDAPKPGDVAAASAPAPAAPPQQRLSPQRVSPPRGPAPRYGRTAAPGPRPEEAATPGKAITRPQVKVIEDEPRSKRKIEVIND
jgi:tRNA A-37 threonylcarbamoyl transferase component Bud32